jgi:hypothetical protein
VQCRREWEPDRYVGKVGDEGAVSGDEESVAAVDVLERRLNGMFGTR